MAVKALASKLNGYQRVALDTAPFIYHFEDNPQYVSLTRELFNRIEKGQLMAITSALTLTEVLTGPKSEGDKDLVAKYQRVFGVFPNLHITAIDIQVAVRAADLRANFGLKTPDALQLAVATGEGAQLFVTNDSRLKKVSDIEILVLDDYV